jgi:hypothetical protein
MPEPDCLGRVRCPRGKYGRMSCVHYQECLDILILNLLKKNGIASTLLKVKQIINDVDKGGISDAIIFSRIYNIANKERIKIDRADFDSAIKASTLSGSDKRNVRRLFEELLGE